MIDKQVPSVAAAVADVFDGAAVMIGGFGEAGSPIELIHALIDQGASGLTVVNNNTGSGEVGLAALIKAGRVSKMICSHPRSTNSTDAESGMAQSKCLKARDSQQPHGPLQMNPPLAGPFEGHA